MIKKNGTYKEFAMSSRIHKMIDFLSRKALIEEYNIEDYGQTFILCTVVMDDKPALLFIQANSERVESFSDFTFFILARYSKVSKSMVSCYTDAVVIQEKYWKATMFVDKKLRYEYITSLIDSEQTTFNNIDQIIANWCKVQNRNII